MNGLNNGLVSRLKAYQITAYHLLIFCLLVVPIDSLQAQAACPPGTIPYGAGQGQEVCGPDGSQQQSGQQQQPKPVQWLDQWMAVATDAQNSVIGDATNRPSQRAAANDAMLDCRSKGGVNCKIENTYRNGCAAMVVGKKGYALMGGLTIDLAVQKGMKLCGADGDSTCHVYYSACSLPVQIQ